MHPEFFLQGALSDAENSHTAFETPRHPLTDLNFLKVGQQVLNQHFK
jgi:hypothetical protein